MSTDDRRFTLVYNGEIYNAVELRRELASRGHTFRGRCDTEVVLRGYAEWGPQLLDRLNGMWAFAIWDRQRRQLLLARDRLGIKPLVYSSTRTGLVFASEIKSLLASGKVDRSLDLTALPAYLSGFVVPEPYTLLAGVKRLPAGYYLIVDGSGLRQVRYWDCNVEEEEDRGSHAYQVAIQELLADAVQRQLVSDVPLGSFLSGGIDSALVTRLAASNDRSERLRSFTIGFPGGAHDERPQAAALSAVIGTRHMEEVVRSHEVGAVLPDLLAAHDEPSQSLIQSFFISRFARQHVTVALSGIGGDELFSSYPAHVLANAMAHFDRLPRPLRTVATAFAGVMPFTRWRRIAALARMHSDDRASQRFLPIGDSVCRRQVLTPDLRANLDLELPVHHVMEHFSRSMARHPLNRMLYVYVKTYLSDELLRTMDTMSMLNSLEVRVPMLDHRLVELAMRIPARHKMRFTTGKLILRQVARNLLPVSTIQKAKRGFNVPLDVWLRDELRDMLRDVLSTSALRRRGVFEPTIAAQLVQRYLDGDPRVAQTVMMVLTFELWAQGLLTSPQSLTAET